MAAVLLLIPAILLLLQTPSLAISISEVDALLLLKSSFNGTEPVLASWFSAESNSSSPCGQPRWAGVLCFGGIVTGLRLRNLDLSGTIDVNALTHLPGLRTLSFVNNSLSGPIPDFSRLDALKSLYLSHNNFSGPIPDSLFAPMDHLKKLWLNNNAFSGEIPSSLSKATSLLELHIENNEFSGVVPNLPLPSLRSFNASNNGLSGRVPSNLVRFGASAFLANSGLCGSPVSRDPCPSPAPEKARKPSSTTVPESDPAVKEGADGGGKTSHAAFIVIGVLAVFIFLLIGFFVFKKRAKINDINSVSDRDDRASVVVDVKEAGAVALQVHSSPTSGSPGHKRVGSSRGSGSVGGGSSSGGGSGGSGAILVMVNSEREPFGLPDLMKSAAEVLGTGSLGSAYKAIMAGGFAVVVKRMRELSRLNKEGFDHEMRRFGRLNHPNVLTPLAYHYRKEEKLVVFDYVPKGSLLYVLHEDRRAEHAALDWETRLKIIVGVARGMVYLHEELASYEVPHGNLKTANILLSPSFDPLLTDYGLIALVNTATAPTALFSFKSPEAQHLRRVFAKSDVFCFGVVVLEILTGKFPTQYLTNTMGGTDVVQWVASAISEAREYDLIDPAITGKTAPTPEMVQLLRVGAACTQLSPEERPEMKEAAELVNEIAEAAAKGSGQQEVADTVGLGLSKS